ncbi:hypothetical protein C1637_15450 [Chryseobacterium lactis]|uniref:Uncharacterized protein n=1 Tax=Chryseobacterium lactis TaxID=1241981 RepID=A0A3G6RQZ3_CHRLC|nr:hypothetical protein [Chryseobacterium lactis]AZA83496.1 hypothetical protein EG342_17115 [Chryseobacterium lactis]AZB03880.1 hypothetical protein EG341_07990 [Chryseobacterium lactis]PNW13210.1 hypothetical protein C1637_15450 [Chryseobacterium lactis]
MSYNIQLFRIETKEKEQRLNLENFFENDENLVPFTDQQLKELKEILLQYGYDLTMENQNGFHFNHQDEDFGMVLLTSNGLYFNTSWNRNSIFETGMVASEFTDTGEFSKYDPQNNG